MSKQPPQEPSMDVLANLDAFSHDSNARHKAIERLEAKIKLLSDAPANEERTIALNGFRAKLDYLKSQG